MRIIILGIVLNCFSAFTQKPDRFIFNSTLEVNKTFSHKEPFPVIVNASFPGGMKEFDNFIKVNIVYPEAFMNKGLRAKIYVRFTIEQDGTVNDVAIVRGMTECPECDNEIKRLFESMPKWIPAVNIKNEIKKSFYSLPFTFRMH